jgi:hypothetical protein
LQSSKVAAVAANAISAATALGKRRRAEYNNLTQADASAVDKRVSKRCSAITQKSTAPCPAVEEKVRPLSKKVVAVKFAAESIAEGEDERATAGVKRLREEISRLTIENNSLLSEQFTRETDIRIEVLELRFFFIGLVQFTVSEQFFNSVLSGFPGDGQAQRPPPGSDPRPPVSAGWQGMAPSCFFLRILFESFFSP